MVPRPQWIVFDAADTLLCPEPDVATVYERVAREFGEFVSRDAIKARFQPAIRKHFLEARSSEELDRRRWRALVFEVLETQDDRIFDALWEHFAQPTSWRLYADVEPTWSVLQEQGFRLAIASNFDARLLQLVSALLPSATTEHVFLSSQLGFRKPSTQFFREIERHLDAHAQQLLMIGDSQHADFEGALAAGWQALLLDRSRDEDNPTTIHSLASITSKFERR